MRPTRTAETQRHGCRTGMALIASGRPAVELGGPVAMSVTSGDAISRRDAGRADRVVVVELHLGARDRAVDDAVLVEDLLVEAVVHYVLDCVCQRRLERACLDEGQPVRREAARLTGQLELAVRLLDLVGRDRAVEESSVGASLQERGVRVRLLVEAQHLDPLAGPAVFLC